MQWLTMAKGNQIQVTIYKPDSPCTPSSAVLYSPWQGTRRCGTPSYYWVYAILRQYSLIFQLSIYNSSWVFLDFFLAPAYNTDRSFEELSAHPFMGCENPGGANSGVFYSF